MCPQLLLIVLAVQVSAGEVLAQSMMALLPGIDANDEHKAQSVFHFYVVAFSSLPVIEVSQLTYLDFHPFDCPGGLHMEVMADAVSFTFSLDHRDSSGFGLSALCHRAGRAARLPPASRSMAG